MKATLAILFALSLGMGCVMTPSITKEEMLAAERQRYMGAWKSLYSSYKAGAMKKKQYKIKSDELVEISRVRLDYIFRGQAHLINPYTYTSQPWRANLESRTRGYTTPTVDERMERLRTETNIQAQERQRENMERFNRQMNSSIADSRRRDAERLKQNAASPYGPSFYKDKNGLWRPRPR
jgi:hypothetical protein